MSLSYASMAPKRKIIITTGDSDGIGLEVTIKALNALGPQRDCSFIFYRSALTKVPKISARFARLRVQTLEQALGVPAKANSLIEIVSSDSPAAWVEDAAQACMDKRAHALVTAPLSKIAIRNAGLKDIGHTEILSRISGQKNLFMGFIGKKFSVVLATAHIPLAHVTSRLTAQQLDLALNAAQKLRQILPRAKAKKPVALVGLNPHAGEEGLIGKEEKLFIKVLAQNRNKMQLVGPLVPDAAFLPNNWAKYSVYVCPYHDQGLVPFKMIHGFRGGVHLTLGIPFVRTSVDHGTAKDLYGRNRAESGSMQDALKAAIRLSKE